MFNEKLEKFCEVKFTCRSKDTYIDRLDEVDWVVVATPNDTHYVIVRNCISAGKNVFCEKPLTPTEEQSKLLFNYAEMKGTKLYVDDIQNYRDYDFEIMEHNLVERRKSGGGDIKNILYVLTYHDIYILYKYIKNSEIENVILIDNKNRLHFKVKFMEYPYFRQKVVENDITIEFLYDLNYEKIEHYINGCSLRGEDDILFKMLLGVFNEEVDFEYNKKISLFTNRVIDILNSKLFKEIIE